MATRRTGIGTTVKIGSTTIGNIRDTISGPNLSRDYIDITDMSSLNGSREWLSGLRDSGELTMNICYNPTSSTDHVLRTNFYSDTPDTLFEINLANSGTKLLFSGSVANLGLQVPLEDVISQDVSIRITGPVIVSGSAWV